MAGELNGAIGLTRRWKSSHIGRCGLLLCWPSWLPSLGVAFLHERLRPYQIMGITGLLNRMDTPRVGLLESDATPC